MSLVDIQKEIRELEKLMEEVNKRVSRIHKNLEETRENEEVKLADYTNIENTARQIKWKTHPLGKLEEEAAKKLYLSVLASLLRIDSEGQEDKMIFLQWLLQCSKLNTSLEDILKDGYLIGKNDFDELPELLSGDYRLYLILDVLILANRKGTCNEDAALYIVNICSILGLAPEEIRVLAELARMILEQSIGLMKNADKMVMARLQNKFRHYLPKEFTLKDRILTLKLNTRFTDFKWKVKQEVYIEKDQLIAIYGKKEIKALREGILFQFKEGDFHYGVISNIFDNRDSAKSWATKKA